MIFNKLNFTPHLPQFFSHAPILKNSKVQKVHEKKKYTKNEKFKTEQKKKSDNLHIYEIGLETWDIKRKKVSR